MKSIAQCYYRTPLCSLSEPCFTFDAILKTPEALGDCQESAEEDLCSSRSCDRPISAEQEQDTRSFLPIEGSTWRGLGSSSSLKRLVGEILGPSPEEEDDGESVPSPPFTKRHEAARKPEGETNLQETPKESLTLREGTSLYFPRKLNNMQARAPELSYGLYLDDLDLDTLESPMYKTPAPRTPHHVGQSDVSSTSCSLPVRPRLLPLISPKKQHICTSNDSDSSPQTVLQGVSLLQSCSRFSADIHRSTATCNAEQKVDVQISDLQDRKSFLQSHKAKSVNHRHRRTSSCIMSLFELTSAGPTEAHMSDDLFLPEL